MDVAHEWGLRPREWDRAHPGEKARMMAYTVVKRTMDAWHLEEGEKKALQLFVEYAATAVSCWRFWKYHIDTQNAEKSDWHWQMAHSAQRISGVPRSRFLEVIFN